MNARPCFRGVIAGYENVLERIVRRGANETPTDSWREARRLRDGGDIAGVAGLPMGAPDGGDRPPRPRHLSVSRLRGRVGVCGPLPLDPRGPGDVAPVGG